MYSKYLFNLRTEHVLISLKWHQLIHVCLYTAHTTKYACEKVCSCLNANIHMCENKLSNFTIAITMFIMYRYLYVLIHSICIQYVL